MDRMLDLESGTIHELNKPVPGMWRLPSNPDLCCIYRVPNCLRHVNPEAYTPQLVIIGPLHHSLKSQALKFRGDITNANSIGYLNMEEHKKFYLAEFARRLEGKTTIDGFRRIIEEDEAIIRESYSESTRWIQSSEFVEMILHDSVFILELILRRSVIGPERTGDPLMDEPCLSSTIKRDLLLLENQLPYFILKKLFDPIVPRLHQNQTLRELVVRHFLFKNIEENSTFRHFTDLVRCVRVETLPERGLGDYISMERMYNADKLDSGGVKIVATDEELPVEVKFINGCLMIPRFLADDEEEITLRNIMALEQCHYPFKAYVCSYVKFLDYLIDTEKDVQLLVEKGILLDWEGHHASVAKMVNKLCLGVTEVAFYYSTIAVAVNAYSENQCNRARATLKRVYFSDPWRGTATVAAILLVLPTLIQTVTSIIQTIHK